MAHNSELTPLLFSLPRGVLHLKPILGAPGAVGRVFALGHDALEPHGARVLKDCCTVVEVRALLDSFPD